MKNKIKMSVAGLGARGGSLIKNVLCNRDDIEIIAVCDVYPDRVEKNIAVIKEKTGVTATGYSDYKQMFAVARPDAVLVSAAWEYHTEIAVAALKAGVAVAMEVGGCYSEEEMWELVRAWEQSGTPFMFMENCCYDKAETLATNMVRAGKFGEIVHCSGAYSHDLREEIACGDKNRHYRLRNYLNRNCENYPTHELGPIAKLLKINAGNRFVSLVSVASKSAGMERYVADNKDKYAALAGKKFAQGDVVNTIITCAGGQTILLRLDTTLPRFYERDFIVRGTKGFYSGNCNIAFIDGVDPDEFDTSKAYKEMFDSGKRYSEFLPEPWKNITPEQMKAGHGGMDWLEFEEFFTCLKENKPMPLDVYDAASLMIVSVLSEQSIAKGGVPVAFPDFTGGKWLVRKNRDVNLIG